MSWGRRKGFGTDAGRHDNASDPTEHRGGFLCIAAIVSPSCPSRSCRRVKGTTPDSDRPVAVAAMSPRQAQAATDTGSDALALWNRSTVWAVTHASRKAARTLPPSAPRDQSAREREDGCSALAASSRPTRRTAPSSSRRCSSAVRLLQGDLSTAGIVGSGPTGGW